MRLRLIAVMLALATLSSGCGLFTSLNEQWVRSDRATFDAVAPLHRAFLEGRITYEQLTEAERKLALGTLAAWEFALLTAEGAINE